MTAERDRASGGRLREATEEDMEAVRDIYARYVLESAVSFEITPPEAAEMGRRRSAIVELGLPFLVAEWQGRVRGFAYAAPFRPRPAYRYTVEDSVYVAEEALGHGLGRMLVEGLIERCTALGYRQMVAVIGDSANRASIEFHARLGFHRADTLKSVGFKFGRWIDVMIMRRPLGEGDGTLPGE